MISEKSKITIQSGESVPAQTPVIISASRATDIPAFYSDWFIDRLKNGYVRWKNPFNGVPLYISFENVRLVVFWSKNPKPILKHLDYLDKAGINYYFQYTLNDYDKEKIEKGVPKLTERIETFKILSERIGKDKIIWRFDPLVLTDTIDIELLLKKIEGIGNLLHNYTNKLIFSFADIKQYKKVFNNLQKSSTNYREFTEAEMLNFASGLQKLNGKWNFELATCAESIPLEHFGIIHNKCIDDDLIIKLFPEDKILMDFLGVKITAPDIFNPESHLEKTKDNRDKGQRLFCSCIVSKDIGEYNTCPHFCEYCYANSSQEAVIKNYRFHKIKPNSDTITGQ
jgi:hypothetical protein